MAFDDDDGSKDWRFFDNEDVSKDQQNLRSDLKFMFCLLGGGGVYFCLSKTQTQSIQHGGKIKFIDLKG